MTEYGYIRVSGMDQNEERQLIMRENRVPTGIKDYKKVKGEFKRCTF